MENGSTGASQAAAHKLSFLSILIRCAIFKPVSAASFPDSFFRGVLFILLSSVLFFFIGETGCLLFIRGVDHRLVRDVSLILYFTMMVSISVAACLIAVVINRLVLGHRYLIGRNFLLFSTTLLHTFIRLYGTMFYHRDAALLFYFLYFVAYGCLANYYVQGCLLKAGELDRLDADARFKMRLLIFIEVFIIVHAHWPLFF
ncbi:hypothetical protein PAPHI01_1947 [Pancytospora philotis]|nr:hypothetical protein PAPHI01_1947 [Pancytospora philotis]